MRLNDSKYLSIFTYNTPHIQYLYSDTVKHYTVTLSRNMLYVYINITRAQGGCIPFLPPSFYIILSTCIRYIPRPVHVYHVHVVLYCQKIELGIGTQMLCDVQKHMVS